MLIQANDATPVEYKGAKYGPLTMGDMGKLIDLTVPPKLRPFCVVTDASRIARSPLGLPVFIRLMAEKHGKPPERMSPIDALLIAEQLLERFWGDDALTEPGEGTGEAPDPLAVTPSTTDASPG